MAHQGGQVGWDDVTIIRKKVPQGGQALKSQQAINAAQRQGLEIETAKKCKQFVFFLL